MNIEATVRPETLDSFNTKLRLYVELFGNEAEEVVRRWTTVLIKEVFARTPPHGSKGPRGPKAGQGNVGESAKKQGERAVIRDVRRAVEPVFYQEGQARGLAGKDFWVFSDSKSIRKVVKEKNEEAFRKIIDNNPKMKKYTIVKFTPELHTSVRNSQNRVTSGKNKFTLDADQWKMYAKDVQNRVGKLKASWIPVLRALKLDAPGWVARHASYGDAVTHVEDNLSNPSHSIRIDNNSKGIGRMKSFINYSMGLIAERMTKDIQFKIKYLERKTGMRIQ